MKLNLKIVEFYQLIKKLTNSKVNLKYINYKINNINICFKDYKNV